MPLLPITNTTFYLPGANNLGVIATGDGGAIAIDTGLDREAGRLLRKALDEAKLKLRAVINTHHHADHIGGNAYLQRNIPDLLLCAPPIEAALIENPILEPIYLGYGASPHNALRTRWLMAQGSNVQRQIGTLDRMACGHSEPIEVAGVRLELLPLFGHSIAQVGVVYDGVAFVADGFFGRSVLAKHGIPYAHNIADQLATIDRLAQRNERFFLPGHGELVAHADLADQLEANRAAILRASDLVLGALAEPGDLTVITARVLAALNHQLAGIPQYVIFTGAIAAHLSLLEQQGRAAVTLTAQGLLWQQR